MRMFTSSHDGCAPQRVAEILTSQLAAELTIEHAYTADF